MTLFISQTAGEQLYQLIDYLEQRWSVKVKDNFIAKLQRSMDIIEKIPYGFPASQSFPGLRKCVITSQTIAYYRINEDQQEIEIIAVIDARQNFHF